MASRIEELEAALRPFAAMVHYDGDNAPYPEEIWSPLLIAAWKAMGSVPCECDQCTRERTRQAVYQVSTK